MNGRDDRPAFNAIYLDSNILIANRWPNPTPALYNLLRLAHWWKITPYVPEPVLEEVESHWFRGVADAAQVLASAARKFCKIAAPIRCEVTLKHSEIEELRGQFRDAAGRAIADLEISRVDYTQRPTHDLFRHATRYIRPFAKDGEGRGFQDATILLSVIDHVCAHSDVSGVLVTNDGDFKRLDYRAFSPDFDLRRLDVQNFDTVFKLLVHPYVDETRIKPYRKLRESAERLAGAKLADIREFISSRLTIDMVKPGPADTIQELVEVNDVRVLQLEVPFPDVGTVMGSIDVTIKVLATFRALVSTDIASLRAFFGETAATPAAPLKQERTISWYGVIQATGVVANGEVSELQFQDLASDES